MMIPTDHVWIKIGVIRQLLGKMNDVIAGRPQDSAVSSRVIICF